jgi:hypothetical protein
MRADEERFLCGSRENEDGERHTRERNRDTDAVEFA